MVFPDDVSRPQVFADYQGNHSNHVPLDAQGVSPAKWTARSYHAASGDSGDWATGGFGYKNAHDWDGVYQDIMRIDPRTDGDWDRDGNIDLKTSALAHESNAIGNLAYHAEWDILEPTYLHAGNYTRNAGRLSADLDPYNDAIARGYKDLVNAPLLEGMIGETFSIESFAGWDIHMRYYKRGMTLAENMNPQHIFYDAHSADIPGTHSLTDWGRYGLCNCLMDNGYFGLKVTSAFEDAFILNEFDIDMGSAVDAPKYDGADPTTSVTGSGYLSEVQGIYWREFDNHLALVNPKDNGDQTFTLPVISGFELDHLGAADFNDAVQDSDVNDGATNVTTLTLKDRHGQILKKRPV